MPANGRPHPKSSVTRFLRCLFTGTALARDTLSRLPGLTCRFFGCRKSNDLCRCPVDTSRSEATTEAGVENGRRERGSGDLGNGRPLGDATKLKYVPFIAAWNRRREPHGTARVGRVLKRNKEVTCVFLRGRNLSAEKRSRRDHNSQFFTLLCQLSPVLLFSFVAYTEPVMLWTRRNERNSATRCIL